jgi:hypothetical protein
MKRRINDARRKDTTDMKPITVIFSTDKGSPVLKSMISEPPRIRVLTQTFENIVVDRPFSKADFDYLAPPHAP